MQISLLSGIFWSQTTLQIFFGRQAALSNIFCRKLLFKYFLVVGCFSDIFGHRLPFQIYFDSQDAFQIYFGHRLLFKYLQQKLRRGKFAWTKASSGVERMSGWVRSYRKKIICTILTLLPRTMPDQTECECGWLARLRRSGKVYDLEPQGAPHPT